MRKSVRALVLGTTAAATAVLAFGQPALADPPGNNSTIKLDTRAFDDDPNNEPHVGCRFQVDFYGYDAGNYNATVTFSVHPPTGKPAVLLTDSVFIGEDAAGGGTDLDASVTYRLQKYLNQGGYLPQPQQGYHVKVEVNAPKANGADKKSKVFWVEPCASDGGGGSDGGSGPSS